MYVCKFQTNYLNNEYNHKYSLLLHNNYINVLKDNSRLLFVIEYVYSHILACLCISSTAANLPTS